MLSQNTDERNIPPAANIPPMNVVNRSPILSVKIPEMGERRNVVPIVNDPTKAEEKKKMQQKNKKKKQLSFCFCLDPWPCFGRVLLIVYGLSSMTLHSTEHLLIAKLREKVSTAIHSDQSFRLRHSRKFHNSTSTHNSVASETLQIP